jgi:hypothetical protein
MLLTVPAVLSGVVPNKRQRASLAQNSEKRYGQCSKCRNPWLWVLGNQLRSYLHDYPNLKSPLSAISEQSV